MINIRMARRGAALLGVGLALAATGPSSAVASPPNPGPTVEWRTNVDGYTISFVGEYFGGPVRTVEWRTDVDGYKISFVGEHFGG